MPSSLCQCMRCCHCLHRGRQGAFLLKSPSFPEDELQDCDDADPGAALVAALNRPGGQVQALRHLETLLARSLDPLKYIDSEQLSRMALVGKRFDEFACLALPDFGRQGGWSTGIAEESGLWFAYRVDGSSQSMHVVVVQDMRGISPVRALVGYCASQLFHEHSSDVQSCSVLAHSADSAVWKQVRQSGEDVVQVDLANALDERLGAIMVMAYPQPDGSPEFAVPGPSGRLRSRPSRQCITLTPLPGGSVRMQVAAMTCLGDRKARLEVEQASVAGMARLMRPLVSVWPRSFEAFLRERQEQLVYEEAFSPHAPFYAVCRGYLAGQAGSKRSSLHQWGFMFDTGAGK